MALNTAGDLIAYSLRAAGINGVGQDPSPEDSNDSLVLLNMILSEWQLNRWLVLDLVEAVAASTGAASYSVGAAGAFVLSYAGARPERIDAASARVISSGVDQTLYPFMSREGFDRIVSKATIGVPEAYFYDATAGATGAVYFYPVPDATWSLRLKAKASLGQFANLTAPLSILPAQYTTAMMWALAQQLRPLYGMPDEPSTSARAAAALVAIAGSAAQLAQAQTPVPSRRAGIYSHVVPAAPPGPAS